MKWEEMVREKLEALLRRKEPRDFFDLYFLIRARLGLKKIGALKEKLLNEVRALDRKASERELERF